MTGLFQDIRYALRQLRKSPGFATTAIAVLALGIGANIAVFTLLDGILLRPLPYDHADRIVAIHAPSANGFTMLMHYANLKQLADAAGSTVKTGMMLDQSTASVAGPGGRFQLEKSDVTANFFSVLGVQPIIGTGFRADENDPGREHEVMLSEGAWRKLYNSDRSVVGKTLTIKGEVYTIAGVMPQGFSFPFDDELQVWSPAAIDTCARTSMSCSPGLSCTRCSPRTQPRRAAARSSRRFAGSAGCSRRWTTNGPGHRSRCGRPSCGAGCTRRSTCCGGPRSYGSRE